MNISTGWSYGNQDEEFPRLSNALGYVALIAISGAIIVGIALAIMIKQ